MPPEPTSAPRGDYGHTAELHSSFGDGVHVILNVLVDFVEQFVQSDERRALDVPMRLLCLRLQVDSVGQSRVQQIDRLHTNFFREIVLCLKQFFHLLLMKNRATLSGKQADQC
jgi:hypothetical protein